MRERGKIQGGRKRPGEDIGDKDDKNDGAHLEKVLLGPDEMVAKRELEWDQFDLQEVKELRAGSGNVLKEEVKESRMLQSSTLVNNDQPEYLLQIKIESIRYNFQLIIVSDDKEMKHFWLKFFLKGLIKCR